ncbi:MAG: VWA domain-containing protein [Spirochaetaceae bacterium]|nr:VWA domain-containing protein [Spirochaetaceae bacterium]
MRCGIFFASLALFITIVNVNAQDLTLLDSDLWLSQGADGGFHLYIRKKPKINSVLLTETTKDPSLQEDNYAYRAAQWNPVNGDEYRLIDGAVISKETNIWSLVDSTPEYIAELGTEVFHVYIPYILYFGYESGRHGEVYVGDGTYLNIRTFELPYADYRGKFKDNPFLLRINQEELDGLPEDNFMQDAFDAYYDISAFSGGRIYRSRGPEDIVDVIARILAEGEGGDLDIVFCLDATASMKNDIAALKKDLVLVLEKTSFSRVGIVLYKDHFDDFVTKLIPFTNDMKDFKKSVEGITVSGGRDIPEAVHEAIYDAAVEFPWEAERRKIILIGDAPPHPRQRGKISKEDAYYAVRNRNIKVDAILLPQ